MKKIVVAGVGTALTDLLHSNYADVEVVAIDNARKYEDLEIKNWAVKLITEPAIPDVPQWASPLPKKRISNRSYKKNPNRKRIQKQSRKRNR